MTKNNNMKNKEVIVYVGDNVKSETTSKIWSQFITAGMNIIFKPMNTIENERKLR